MTKMQSHADRYISSVIEKLFGELIKPRQTDQDRRRNGHGEETEFSFTSEKSRKNAIVKALVWY